MRWMIGIAAAVLAAGCSKGSDRCERLLDKFEQQCVADRSRTFSVDGKPAGQLMSTDEAKRQCRDRRPHELARCRKFSDDVFACAEKEYDDNAGWKNDARCQAILERNFEDSKPKATPAP